MFGTDFLGLGREHGNQRDSAWKAVKKPEKRRARRLIRAMRKEATVPKNQRASITEEKLCLHRVRRDVRQRAERKTTIRDCWEEKDRPENHWDTAQERRTSSIWRALQRRYGGKKKMMREKEQGRRYREAGGKGGRRNPGAKSLFLHERMKREENGGQKKENLWGMSD